MNLDTCCPRELGQKSLAKAYLGPGEEESPVMAKDPVCGMQVVEATAAGTSEHREKTYYFCSRVCKAAFDKDPEKYASRA